MSGEGIEMESSLRRELEREFKPLFDDHGPQGIRLDELRGELNDRGMQKHIPSHRIDMLLREADRNRDRHLTYGEFINLMTGDEVSRTEMSAMRKFVGVAVENIVPRRMRDDFLANYSCCPPPVFMITASVAEIIVFIIYALELANAGTPVTANSGVPTYSPFIYKPTRRYEAWRYLTYMLIHQGILHLVANLVFQLLLGLPLELVHKPWRVMVVYICGVIAGSLAHSLTDHHVLLAGASGGCYAIIGAHIAAVITNWKEMNYKCCEGSPFRFLLSAPVRLTVLLLLAGGDTANAVYRRFAIPNSTSNVGISAHIGGLLAGLLLGIPVMKNVNELPWEKTLGWVALAIYLTFVAFALFFNGLYQGYPPTDWTACCP